MKRIFILSLAISFLFLLDVINPDYISAQKSSAEPIEIDLEIPKAPTPVKYGGKFHLFYELHITNFRDKDIELDRIEVLEKGLDARLLATYKDAELSELLVRPGERPNAPAGNKKIIGGAMRLVVFFQITVSTEADIPFVLHHRLFFKPDEGNKGGEQRIIEGADVKVRRSLPLVIAPPLRGDRWYAANGLSNGSTHHRRSLISVDGKVRIAQRFATDWIQLGEDGKAFRGDPQKNENWYCHGKEVLAVADATVVDVYDEITKENIPLADELAIPITLETLGGNYIILDLGNGYFAFYAHLIPNSPRVKVGDKVKRGQVLALLGNTGNSGAPHLHFHISDTNSPVGAEGVPFVFESFDLQGRVKSLDEVLDGKSWKPDAAPDKRLMETPTIDEVIRFIF